MKDWIKWKGGDCPVDWDTKVDVRHRDGEELLDQTPGLGSAEYWSYAAIDFPGDIVAWRLSK